MKRKLMFQLASDGNAWNIAEDATDIVKVTQCTFDTMMKTELGDFMEQLLRKRISEDALLECNIM